MKGNHDGPEGHKVEGLKRLERSAIRIQTVVIIVAFLFLIYVGGMGFDPFFLPLFWPFMAILIGMLILAIQYFVFRLVEIKRLDCEDTKFKVADISMKKAYTGIVVGLIAFTIIFVPFFIEQVEEINRKDGRIVGFDEYTILFTSRGSFDFLYADDIRLEAIGEEDHDPVNVFIIRKEAYRSGRDDYGHEELINHGETQFYDSFEFNMIEEDFDEYYIVLQTDSDVEISFDINYIIPEHIINNLQLIFIAFVIANVVGVIALYPLKKNHLDNTN